MLFSTKNLAIQGPRKVATHPVCHFHAIHKIGTYELDLPSSLQAHPVFHNFLLKPSPLSLVAQWPLAISTVPQCQYKSTPKLKTKRSKKEKEKEDQEY